MEIVQFALIQEAKRHGVIVDLLENCATENILLSKDGKQVLFGASATPLDQLSYQAFFTAGNKQFCKKMFEKLAISYPQSIVFKDLKKAKPAIEAFLKRNQLYVCKPLAGTEGRGVCMNLRTIADITKSWNVWKEEYEDFMIEEQVEGGDLRIQAIGGKIVAACVREPATIVGDGQSTVNDLVVAKRAVIEAQNPANTLVLDAASFDLLEQQKLTVTSIPKANQSVQLKYVANMNQGARSIDITDAIHPDYNQWIAKITKELNLSIFALDVLTTNYTESPTAKNAWALEINGEPYWYHHTFSENKTHNIAKLILDDVFGTTKN